jgi:tetrahydromethanopterin S-methyltransferase subunit C
MSSWQSIKLFFLSFGIMNAAYSGLSAIFGIPAWITGLAGLLVTILIGFTIYSAIFQKEL